MKVAVKISMALLLCHLLSSLASGQDPDKQAEIATLAEDLVGTPDDDESFEASYEGLVQAISRPLNLNQSDLDPLVSLRLLTHEEAERIKSYRVQNGAFVSYYELQAVPELSLETIQRIRPFVTVVSPTSTIDRGLLRRIRKESDNYFMVRVSRAWNTARDHDQHAGSPEHMLLRFRSQRPGDFSIGFNGEKDSGEPITWDAGRQYYGIDRWSFHVQIQNKGLVKNLIVGDLQAQFGQGLVFGGAFGPGKGAETITTMRRVNVGILPYTSAYEAGNMRGLGLTMSLPGKMELTLLGSTVLRDASLEIGEDRTLIRSLQKSGLHRTVSELASRQQARDTQFGLVLSRRTGALEAGVLFDYTMFQYPVEPATTPYNQYAFHGRTLAQSGMFVSYNAGRFSTFGELATSHGGGTGFVGGVLGAITKHLDVALLIRSYDPDFHTRFSNAISESSTASNERGVYSGWRYQFSRKLWITGYLDLFSFPWLRYRAYAPSFGHEWLWRISYQPSRNLMMFIQARQETKARNVSEASQGYPQSEGVKSNYWIHVETGLREHFRFRTKFQASTFTENGLVTHGLALSQDVSLKVGRFQLTGRYAVFDADSYDNRLYFYENDVLFAYSMPAYNGIGTRKMLMLQCRVSRWLTVWTRYAETLTSLPERLSPRGVNSHYQVDREVRFQLRIQF